MRKRPVIALEQLRMVNRRLRSLRLAFVVLLCLFVVALVGCQSGPVPKANFVAQAEVLHQQALRTTVVSDPELNEYVNELGRRVIAGATAADAGNTRDPTLANMSFHVVGSPMINAFTTGGGHIYLYAG